MGAWVLDYVANWVGEHGDLVHASISLRAPVFTGDVTYLDGEVTAAVPDGTVAIEVRMTNQRDAIVAKATVDVRLG
jgi:acyl dehydratase